MVELSVSLTAVIIVATIGGLFLMLYLFKKYREYQKVQKKLNAWPPMYNKCPDYWADLGDGRCQNNHNLGSCPRDTDGMLEPNGIMNFSAIGDVETKEGRRSLCYKAKECGLTWENVDNMC